MLQLKPLPKAYQLDLDHCKPRGKAPFMRIFRTPHRAAPKGALENESKLLLTLRELVHINDKLTELRVFQHIKRGRSSESLLEGFPTKKCCNVFLSLPNNIIPHHRSLYLRKKWRCFINAVRAVLRYKHVKIAEFLMALPEQRKLLIPLSPKTLSKSQSHKIKRHSQMHKLDTFGEYLDTLQAERRERLKQSRERMILQYRKSQYFQEFRQQDSRISRMLNVNCRSSSVQVPRINIRILDSLPPTIIPVTNSKSKRTTSVVIRRIKRIS